MKKIYTFILATCFAVGTFAQGNVNLQVVITKLERTAYSDCAGCGNADPTWIVQGTHNGQGALNYGPYCWSYPEMANTLWDITDYSLMNITNTNATTFTVGLADAFEKNCDNDLCHFKSYNFLTCFPSVYGDSRRCQNSNLATVNFRTQPPCQWNTTNTGWCGDYRFEYSFYWSFNTAPTIITQPNASNNLCMGSSTTLTVAAANDINGWNMGVNYQWQISSSTACPGSNWTDIVGANSASFTPSQIPGTRLYRCRVTANCNLDFSSNTTNSNCVVVTYNPMGSPGDLPPDIVSGICGSTVLPGSTHVLGVLLPPNPGAIVGATDYQWSANAGSPTNYSGSTFTWTAPTDPGTYTINLTYVDNCPQPDAQANACVVNVGSATCDFAYVATYGVDSSYRGGPDNPYKTLSYALTQLSGRKYVRMANGTYNEVNPLPLYDDIVIEGGYNVNGNIWSKNNSDSTVIIGNGTQVISASVAHRVCFVSDAANGWRLQDLTIKTSDINTTTSNGRGYSNYGILALNGSSGFEVVRCKIYAGNAAKGVDGTTPSGSGGAGGGGGGGNGGGGSNTRCNGGGGSGSGGNSGNGGAAGGNAGGGCGGGGCNIFGCNANGCTAANGTSGAAGAAGNGYAANVRPATPPVGTPYYNPAGQAASGSNGYGGGGGGGGGGGDIGTCCSCSCGGGTPDGGAGGNGGGGGLPGSGGFGGGGSFGIYASGAGTNGTLTTTFVLAGNYGLGGDGASGQAGAGGAGGAGGYNHGGCDGGKGGDGGAGGAGGAGGRGQDGANGLSQAIATSGGANISGTSTGVPNTFIVGINYQNSKGCINSEIEMTKSSGVWTFPSGMNFVNDLRDYPAGFPVSSYNASSNPVLVYTTTAGVDYDLTINGNVYSKYLTIAADNRALPAIHNALPSICIDGTDSLSATHWGTEVEYDWRIYQGTNVNSPLYQSTLPSPVINFYGFAPGLYNVRYRVRESCCGWSKAVFDTIRILPQPTIFNAYGGGNYCPGASGSVISLSGSEPGIKYILLFNGVPVDSFIGNGGPINFSPQTGVGNYTITAVRFTGCTSDMFGTVSVGQFPQPQAFSVSGSDTICVQGAVTSAIVKLSGSEVGVNYQLLVSGNIPVGPAIPGTSLPLTFTNITSAGTYFVQAINPTTGCKALMNDSAVIALAPSPAVYALTGGGSFCDGDSGVVIGLSGSDTGTVYQLMQGGVLQAALPVYGTGSSIVFNKVNVPGYYKVRVTSVFGCYSWTSDSVWINKMALPAIHGVVANAVSCNGKTDGSIIVTATSQNGSLNYSIDSALTYQNSGTFSTLAAAYYNVVVKDDSGCVTQFAANPVKVTSPLSLNLTMHGINPDCFGNTTGSASVDVSGGTSPYAYAWSTTPVQTTQQIDLLGGNNTYTVTVTDGNNCTNTGSVQLTEPGKVVVNTIPTNVKCFEGNDGRVVISASGGLPPYDYYLNGIYQFDSIFTGLTAGNYLATAQDANHCTGSATFALTQPQAFTVNAGPDMVSVRGQAVPLNGSASSLHGIIGYFWSPANNLSCTACQTTLANPDSTTTYVLTALDGDSCVGFDSVTVVVKQTVQYFIPSAFTPNDDKLNDYFEMNILGATGIEVTVFNRWGERVYYNANQHNGIANAGDAWDGKKDGKALPYDTYVYQLKVSFFDGSNVTLSGTITLMK